MAKFNNLFRYFDSSPEVIRKESMMNVKDQLAKCGIDICYVAVCLWWSLFGPMSAAETLAA